MNANNWPLEDMQAEEFTVPYPLEECVRRIEGLQQKRHAYFQFALNPRIDYFGQYFRTAVIRNPDYQGQIAYNLGRVQSYYAFEKRSTAAEVNVLLKSSEDNTQVTILTSEHLPAILKWSIWGYVLLTGLAMLSVPISARAGVIDYGGVVGLTFLVLFMFLPFAWFQYKFYFRQHVVLLTQIYQAFGLVYAPKEHES